MDMKTPINITDITLEDDKPFPEPFKSQMGEVAWRRLGDYFGLKQFGVNYEIIQPGACSALRHWHSHADEFVFILEGEMTLITDLGENTLRAGMCAGFKAGEMNGHHLINRSKQPAQILAIGSRVTEDKVHYPDDDIQWLEENGRYIAAKKDGTPYA